MFQGVRQGAILYILEKGDNGLDLKTGQVVNVSNPYPRYAPSGAPNYSVHPEMLVDVSVRVGETTMDFKQLNAQHNIANSGNVVVSDSREAMIAEVDGIVRCSVQAIESVPYHERVKHTGECVMRELNPQFAKEKEHEEKIDALEVRMGTIDTKIDRLFGLLTDSLEHNQSKKEDKI